MSIELMCMDSNATNNGSNQNNGLCATISSGVLRTVHSINKIPISLINAWNDSTISQKLWGQSFLFVVQQLQSILMYLKAQENVGCDCLAEFKRNPGRAIFGRKLAGKESGT